MSVMILAAGLGTRLRPLTDEIPKPLVPVGDRPLLAHILSRSRAFGGKTVINAHHLSGALHAFVEDQGANVFISHEKELLGTAGGLHQATRLLGTDEDVLVWGGDILVDLDVPSLREAHARGAGSAGATLVVNPATPGAGNIGIDAQGRVVRIRDRTVRPGEARGGVFLALHVVGRGLFDRLPAKGGLIEDFYLPLLADGTEVLAWETPATFHDVGSPQAYLEANLAWLAATGKESFVGEGARCDPGVVLDAAVVGRGATVTGKGTLRRAVVWPGAAAEVPGDGVVVTATRVVPVGV